jgi:hypothetical protein
MQTFSPRENVIDALPSGYFSRKLSLVCRGFYLVLYVQSIAEK